MSSADIDSTMRHHWEKLTDREKIPYYNRASNALRDRNRRNRNGKSHPYNSVVCTTQSPNSGLRKCKIQKMDILCSKMQILEKKCKGSIDLTQF